MYWHWLLLVAVVNWTLASANVWPCRAVSIVRVAFLQLGQFINSFVGQQICNCSSRYFSIDWLHCLTFPTISSIPFHLNSISQVNESKSKKRGKRWKKGRGRRKELLLCFFKMCFLNRSPEEYSQIPVLIQLIYNY